MLAVGFTFYQLDLVVNAFKLAGADEVDASTWYLLFIKGCLVSRIKYFSEASVLEKVKFDLSSKTPSIPINSNGNITIDGEPFLPLGIYSSLGIDEYSGIKQSQP